jgi:hypothetical protein
VGFGRDRGTSEQLDDAGVGGQFVQLQGEAEFPPAVNAPSANAARS